MDIEYKRFSDNVENTALNDNDILPLERMADETDGKIKFKNLNKQILHNAKISGEVDDVNATLTIELKDQTDAVISSSTVDLPNTGTIDCEVDEDTAELTVQLKNTKGEVVTSDTVTLPNTSDVECELSATNELTVSLKDKSGEVVTSDSVQLESGKVDSLTQSEYDALSEAEKTNGQIREITDAEGEPIPFAVMNDELTTTSNVLSAQETENRINEALTDYSKKEWKNVYKNESGVSGGQIVLSENIEDYTEILFHTSQSGDQITSFCLIEILKNYCVNKVYTVYGYTTRFLQLKYINGTHLNIPASDNCILHGIYVR